MPAAISRTAEVDLNADVDGRLRSRSGDTSLKVSSLAKYPGLAT
jgi:hypothetical protein